MWDVCVYHVLYVRGTYYNIFVTDKLFRSLVNAIVFFMLHVLSNNMVCVSNLVTILATLYVGGITPVCYVAGGVFRFVELDYGLDCWGFWVKV